MELLLRRYWPNTVCTIGALYIDGANDCFTLERPQAFDGKNNLPNLTCVLPGRFKIIFQPSPHFEASTDPWVQKFAQRMPHLDNVPERSYVMIHWGDFVANTDGCILTGNVRTSMTSIGDSRAAFEALFNKMQIAIAAGQEIWITIENGDEAPDAWPTN